MIKYSPNNIEVIAKRNAGSKFDLDQNKIRYILSLDETTRVNLSSFLIHAAELCKFYLLYNSTKMSLEKQYHQRPDLLSFDMYGTEVLDWLLMFVNDVFCYEDFTIPFVYVPDKNALSQLFDFQINAEVEVK